MKKFNKNNNEGKWVHGACAMCLGAPMKVRVKDEKIVEVKGEDIPGWNGKVCGKAISGTGARVYAPDRILHPLKRVGERGEAKFIRCTWEEVIDAAAAKLKEYIDAGHPEYFEPGIRNTLSYGGDARCNRTTCTSYTIGAQYWERAYPTCMVRSALVTTMSRKW